MDEFTSLAERKRARLSRLQELKDEKDRRDLEALRGLNVFEALNFVPNPGPQTKFLDLPDDNLDVFYGGAAGGSKGGRCPDRAAPSYNDEMETKVLTPKGFKLIGDIEVGDAVCNPDGTTAKVIKLFDNGPRQFYRVTLADGSTVEADDGHLWAISIAGARKRRKEDVPIIPAGLRPEDEWNLRVQSRCRIVTTVELRELVLRADDEFKRGLRPHYVQLPLTNPVAMTNAPGRWPRFTPYILGALIGDGSITHRAITICGIDESIFDRIRNELPEGLELVLRAGKECPTYGISQTVGKAAGVELLEPFVKELKRLRDERGCKQSDLAAWAGTTQSYISMVERRCQWPSRKVVAKLDDALGAEGSLLASYPERVGEPAVTLLERDGLAGLHSWDKFIPQRIKTGSIADRFAFMQGLMDTDGCMDQRGHVSLTTVSNQLARDAQDVLRSLGYRATVSTSNPTYTHNGEKEDGRLAYHLYIQGRHLDRLFDMPRKKERVAKFNGGDVEPWHRVVSVEPTEIDNSRCIQVDNLNHLYVTDDYIVTHNSLSLLLYALRAGWRFPGLQVFWFRRSFPELEQSVLRTLARYGYAKALGCRWLGNKYELKFANGSSLTFGHVKSVPEASALLSAEINLLIIDERTTIPPDVVDLLYTRVRSGVPGVPCLGVRSASNPGNIGHSRVKTEYVDATNRGTIELEDKNGRRRIFIQAKASDTPQLGPEYVRNLSGLPEKLRKAYLEGDWDVFAGQAFDEWRYDRHVMQPFKLPQGWTRVNGIDWGYTAPWCVLWAAVDEDGRVYIYREIYRTRVGEKDQAQMILAAEDDHEFVGARYADDAMWAVRGDAKPIADVYAENGAYLTPAGKGPGSRVSGWQRIHSYLADGPACPHHRSMGWETCPKLHVFPQCRNLIRTLPAMPHATIGNPEDIDGNAEDHGVDALRYLMINIGSEARFFFPPGPAAIPRELDPKLRPEKQGPLPQVPTIGGFPILRDGDPWAD